MKKILLGAVLALGITAFAQNADNNNTPSNRDFTANPRNGSDAAASARPSDDDKYVESDVVPLAGTQLLVSAVKRLTKLLLTLH